MSGSYKKGSGLAFISQTTLDKGSQAILETMFDQQADYDMMECEFIQHETKIYKRLCLIKLILFPMEFILTRLLTSSLEASKTIEIAKISFRFLRNKLTLYQFFEELHKQSLGGIV